MPKLDLDAIRQQATTSYPSAYAGAVKGRLVRKLATATGLTDFGASHVVLHPGAASSQRHWHEAEDELVVVLIGKPTLVDDDGETPLEPGDVAVFVKGEPNGHCVRNDTDVDCVFLAIGRPAASRCHYPDIDMVLTEDLAFRRKDGSAFE